MSFISEIVVILITVYVVLGKLRNYELQMDQIEIINSPGGNSFNFKTLRVTKFNRTIYVGKADFEILSKDMSKVEAAVFVQLMQGNVYKLQPYKVNRKPICDFYKNEFKTILYDGIKDFSNLPAPDDCPFEKKPYWVKNYVFDEGTTNLPPYMGLGKYRFDLHFYENGVESGGFKVYVKAVRPGQAD